MRKTVALLPLDKAKVDTFSFLLCTDQKHSLQEYVFWPNFCRPDT